MVFHCNTFDRDFASRHALKQHNESKHPAMVSKKPAGGRRKKLGALFMPSAPVDSPGEWVLSEEFVGRKSFGWFCCDNCRNVWVSAHSYVDFKQGCQKCECESLPFYMWKNFYNKSRGEHSSNLDGPHDTARCEACRMSASGDCRK